MTTKPRGLFDRSTKGHVMPTVSVLVERGQIRFFARALGETNPVHFDVGAAKAAGYPDLAAPPQLLHADRSHGGRRTSPAWPAIADQTAAL
ncbi:FAS1-like dehydratase domain-containing protein [Blastomonas fulva]|uniref:FAS1-like dehydratase domain-containing protein n=1 Tax=Blastomonas fulva TaxID=1550728 RepID=UPI003D6BE4BE